MRIIDAHVHIGNLNGDHAPLYELAGRLGYEKLALMSTSCDKPVQNVICALCKLRHPADTYAFGGLEYITGRDYKTQAENIYAMGFDGIKMLEGKPTVRRKTGMALDDPVYDGFYGYLENIGFPVLFHAADPRTFWDKKLAPVWAAERGWLYNKDDAPYERYYTEVENMLKKHPRLKAVFAHFFFLSWNVERAQRFLDDHPRVYIDITAGIEMYEDFSRDPEMWGKFFIKNQSRIIFGTDSTDEQPVNSKKPALNGYAGMELEFLNSNLGIEIYGIKLRGLGLPEDARRKILAENFIKLAGNTPRRINEDLLRKEAACLRRFIKDETAKCLKLK